AARRTAPGTPAPRAQASPANPPGPGPRPRRGAARESLPRHAAGRIRARLPSRPAGVRPRRPNRTALRPRWSICCSSPAHGPTDPGPTTPESAGGAVAAVLGRICVLLSPRRTTLGCRRRAGLVTALRLGLLRLLLAAFPG